MSGSAQIQAVIQHGYGGTDVLRLQHIERPAPSPEQVLVRVHASTVSPAECAFRTGKPLMTRLFKGPFRPTFVPGGTLAGVVEEVGPQVTRFAPGDRVFGSTGASFGAHAEYICLAQDAVLAAPPDGITDAEAVALCDGSLTALTFLRDVADVRPGQHVLVNGASGSVGAAGVQLARHLGAEVTGVCSGRNTELVRSLGATTVIDYTQQDFTAVTGAYDVIFDAVGTSSFRRCRRSLARGGVYLTTAPTAGIVVQALWTSATRRKKRARLVLAGLRQTTELVEFVARLAAEGELRPVIDRTYPVEEIEGAHRYVETKRKRGSVVIAMWAARDDLASDTEGSIHRLA